MKKLQVDALVELCVNFWCFAPTLSINQVAKLAGWHASSLTKALTKRGYILAECGGPDSLKDLVMEIFLLADWHTLADLYDKVKEFEDEASKIRNRFVSNASEHPDAKFKSYFFDGGDGI